MVADYRTGHNAAMHLRLPTALFLLLLVIPPAFAWNCTGHRLSALIAWQIMQPGTREFIARQLPAHPDYERWQEKAGNRKNAEIFAEAACWADRIRHDPRYYDETREAPTPAIEGLYDHAKHKRWHYIDLDAEGKVRAGEIDRKIVELSQRLQTSTDPAERIWALIWLIHLVGDIHQPLHVGRHGDEGGNSLAIDYALTPAPGASNLHQYWDDLPGPTSLHGSKLEQKALQLIETHPMPRQASVVLWRNESHRLLDQAYPAQDNGRRVIDATFDRQARQLAEQRLVDAGWRLGRLLDRVSAGVSRGTRETTPSRTR